MRSRTVVVPPPCRATSQNPLDSQARRELIHFRKSEVKMARFDLSDREWGLIRPLLPNKPRGVPRVDDRRTLNGIFYVPGRSWSPLWARLRSANVQYGIEPSAVS
jgi:hypothetical protein